MPRQWNWSLGGWLGLALLIHAALLLLPLRPEQFPTRNSSTLTITLSPFTLVEVERRIEAGAPSEHTPEKATTGAESKPPPAHVPAEEPMGDSSPEPVRTISLARLVESVHDGQLDNPKTVSQRQLGVQHQHEKPSYWRGGIPGALPSENLFDGMVAPAQTEIVDRWIEADGSHNVVVNLPNGETFCGRAAAWDPMRPLVEHVMMFRSCGGGGKRTFTMAPRKYQEYPAASDG